MNVFSWYRMQESAVAVHILHIHFAFRFPNNLCVLSVLSEKSAKSREFVKIRIFVTLFLCILTYQKRIRPYLNISRWSLAQTKQISGMTDPISNALDHILNRWHDLITLSPERHSDDILMTDDVCVCVRGAHIVGRCHFQSFLKVQLLKTVKLYTFSAYKRLNCNNETKGMNNFIVLNMNKAIECINSSHELINNMVCMAWGVLTWFQIENLQYK